MNRNVSWGHLTLSCEFQFSHAERLCPVFLCRFPPWRVDICVTPEHVYCCTRAGDPGQDFLSTPRKSPCLSRQVLLSAELGRDPEMQCWGNSCAEPGAMSQLQLCQGLVTNILHVESEDFATGISFVEKSKIQQHWLCGWWAGNNGKTQERQVPFSPFLFCSFLQGNEMRTGGK